MPVNDSGEDLVRRLYRMAETNPERAAETLRACRDNAPAVYGRVRRRLVDLTALCELLDTEDEHEPDWMP